MRSIHLAMLAFAFTVPLPIAAQSGAAAPAVGTATSDDAAQSAPKKKKKGGLFGKVKGLAKNKVVKTVAKAAACTMIPGGSLIAGAIDGASAKDAAKDAAKGAAKDAALGAATGNNTCIPGMGNTGAAGLAGNVAGGVAGNVAGGLAGAGMPGVGVPGMPTTAIPGAAISPQQMKQLKEQYRKMGMDSTQLAAMEQMMAGMAAEPDKAAAVAPAPAAAPPTVAGPALTKSKGRMVLHRLPWTPGTEIIQPGAEPVFGLAIRDLAGAILASSKRFKIEARVEDQGGKSQSGQLARKRAAVVLAALVAEGITDNRLALAGGGSDKDPRIVVSETK
jgi:hypothetical protein